MILLISDNNQNKEAVTDYRRKPTRKDEFKSIFEVFGSFEKR